MRPTSAPDTLWQQALDRAGYRIIHEPYVLGEVNPLIEPLPPGAKAPFGSLIDATLGLPLAPKRIRP